MGDKSQLERIAVKAKAIESFTVPSFPKLPEWFVSRFDLRSFEAEVETWRQNTQTAIREGLLAAKQLNDLILSGRGSPEGRIASSPGKIYLNLDGGATATVFVKETGTSLTGWVPK